MYNSRDKKDEANKMMLASETRVQVRRKPHCLLAKWPATAGGLCVQRTAITLTAWCSPNSVGARRWTLGMNAMKHSRALPRTAKLSIGLAALFSLPTAASAHVKWFTHTDGRDRPVEPSALLTPTFCAIFCVALLLVFVGFLLDGWIAKRWPQLLKMGRTTEAFEQRVIRAATGAYFIFLSSVGGIILTPDLRSAASWLPVVQFLTALCLLWRPTCIAAGAGVLVLYGYAVAEYGVFHLVDYVFMLTLALYLASLSLPWSRLAGLRERMLSGGLAFSLAWTAIEKFLYPQWTEAVVATHPIIAMGMPLTPVVIVAGFVEFTLAFYLVTGRGLLRIGGVGYMVIFLGAMSPFGKLDIFGHLIIVAILLITVLRGSTAMQDAFYWTKRSALFNAAWITTIYIASLILFVAAYYALQLTTRGPSS